MKSLSGSLRYILPNSNHTYYNVETIYTGKGYEKRPAPLLIQNSIQPNLADNN